MRFFVDFNAMFYRFFPFVMLEACWKQSGFLKLKKNSGGSPPTVEPLHFFSYSAVRDAIHVALSYQQASRIQSTPLDTPTKKAPKARPNGSPPQSVRITTSPTRTSVQGTPPPSTTTRPGNTAVLRYNIRYVVQCTSPCNIPTRGVGPKRILEIELKFTYFTAVSTSLTWTAFHRLSVRARRTAAVLFNTNPKYQKWLKPKKII